MMVKRTHQRLGFGRIMMAAVEKEAKKKGYIAIELNVQSVNSKAIQFYKAIGFEVQRIIEIPYGKPDMRMRKVIEIGPVGDRG